MSSITLGQTPEEKQNAFWTVIHQKEDEFGLLYRQWSLEGLAWVTSVEASCGVDCLVEKYSLPTDDDRSRDEIVALAQNEVAAAFGKRSEELHPFQVAYMQYRDASRPIWYVSFVEGGYALFTRNGELTEAPEHEKYLPQKQFELYGAALTLDLAKEQYADRDYMWPLELQATLLRRSLPDPSLLPQEEAEAIARQAACEKYGLTEETLVSTYRIFPTYFTSYVSSEGQNLTDTWRFLFRPRSDDYFQVFVDATTGEVVEIADKTDTKG